MFLPKLRNEKTASSRQKNRKQTVNKGLLLFFYGTDETTIIQRLNLCRDPSHFSRLDTTAEKLDEMWTGRPV